MLHDIFIWIQEAIVHFQHFLLPEDNVQRSIPLGLIASGIGAIGKFLTGVKQGNKADDVVVPDATYNVSPYAQEMLAEASRLKDSRMTGAEEAGRGIDQSFGDAAGSVGRNATSGSQALALIAAMQGNSNNARNQLRLQEGGDQQQKQANYATANMGMTAELDKVYQDKVRKQQMAMMEKNGLRDAALKNQFGAFNDITNGLQMYENGKAQKLSAGESGYGMVPNPSNMPVAGLGYTPADEVLPE